MRKTIEIGSQEMEFKASAATPILYKHTFKNDLFRDQQKLTEKRDELKKIKKAIEEAKAEGREIVLTDEQTALAVEYQDVFGEITNRLAYIMHLEATRNEQTIWNELELPKYIAFLMKINGGDIQEKANEIFSIYQSSTRTKSSPKNA